MTNHGYRTGRAARAGGALGGIGRAVATLLLVAGPAAAQEAPADTLRTHDVRRGDTLWDLAQQYLRNPFRWPEIFEINRDVVADPHWIYPSERLRIPLAADQTRVAGAEGLQGGAGQSGAAGRHGAGFGDGPVSGPSARTVFWPQATQAAAAHSLRLAAERSAPVVTPGEFFRAGVLMPESRFAPVGQLVELISPTVIPHKQAPQILQFDRVFMTVRKAGEVRIGQRLQLVRQGERVGSHGRIHQPTGMATVVALDGNVATVRIELMYDRVDVGDWAVPVPEYTVPLGVRPEPTTGREGRILAFEAPSPLQAVEDVAHIDLGRNAGLVEGDELVAVLPPERRSWGNRPEIQVARLRVVRVAERTAAVRVVGLQQPALTAGLPVRLVAKMP